MSDSTANMQSLTSLTVANATAALEQGVAAIRAGQAMFDLRNIQAVDSAAVSVLLAWQRAAHEAGVQLELRNLPPMLKSLTKLYGVCALVSPSLADCAGPAVAPGVPPAPPAAAEPPHHHHH
ncbi:STAS domain-containing protein [Pseudoduganella namucuonensis]|uniref:Phospholipid transport system transporter-binding protein n=1 Tax=Pseudoduganella namucuonensis TaxID=1035707 RepID=A0A1I7L1U1_9BURK|nr:STAS domain-containing protein [Pseudoduganella namucuonensis]SFV03742.1 phospholipid transport system transporter-binding protein [Pseudoduganella namucuonensis]